MKPFQALRNRLQPGAPPPPADTFQTLDRPAEPRRRRAKTGRTEQLNVRVRAGFKKRVGELAQAEQETIGGIFEAMLAAYESGAARPQRDVPVAEARKGRVRPLRLWASDEVFDAIGKVAAEREMSISALVEDLLAREVKRLDPHGGKFGVDVKREPTP